MANSNDYLKLVTSEHADQPDFMATVKTLTDGFTDVNNLCNSYPKVYDLDQAVGTQLDVIGLWVGADRRLATPLTGVYFSWDATALLGWDSGSWQGPYDPSTGLSSLPDDAYRLLIKAKIAANNWDGTIPGAQAIYSIIFNGGRMVIIEDHQDMSFTLGFSGGSLTAIEQAMLLGGYIPLKPVGVRIKAFLLAPAPGALFAWDLSSPYMAGWDAGLFAIELYPT